MTTQAERAKILKSLHKKGSPLVLYNIWDAGGAQAIADAGAQAVATGSWSVAAAHGYPDGEAIPLDLLLRIVTRIVETVDVPVSVDFEGGYARDPRGVAENVTQLIQAGAIGINFEDRVVAGEGLYPISDQVARIEAIADVARREEVPLFVNARTDLFLGSDPNAHPGLIPQALEREAAYARAGADGFFVPGLRDPDLIRQITDAASLPVNVMLTKSGDAVAEIAALDVSRVSFGPRPYLDATARLVESFKSII
ncbi:isocitrate lyase/phosphoenolpyruvate mutase family protein [Gymnodinialimonas sp. 2305UL16-5]|uniref:isocitrate lyase/PEP mutase family protein n=1 Tax=Gymnodinialimonas mytili TaxID=3126503 RepID=UPI0030B7C954